MKDTELIPEPARQRLPAAGLQRLLVCLDGSAFSESTLPYALALARASGGELTLLQVLETQSDACTGPTDTTEWHLAHEEAQDYLERTARSIRSVAPDTTVEAVVCQGHPAEQILCHSDRGQFDLIVLSSHGEKGLTEWSLASSAQKVLNRARASVLIVPFVAGGSPAIVEKSLDRVLVLLDGSVRAEAALPPLQRLAPARRTTFFFLHVIAAPSLSLFEPPTKRDLELVRELDERNERAARSYLSDVRGRFSPGDCEVRTLVERGDVRLVLNQVAAREKVDLVVLTAHGMTGNRQWSYGATAGHLLHHAVTPTLMIQNLPQNRSEFAGQVRHVREANPLRGMLKLGRR